jgi:hypothetical protein
MCYFYIQNMKYEFHIIQDIYYKFIVKVYANVKLAALILFIKLLLL